MSEAATIETIPLMTDSDGVIRVSGTRVTLETIVAAFREGATPEEIAQQYPSVPLADIYHVIGYYLRHAAELEPYFAHRLHEAEVARQRNEARWDPEGVRRRLSARRRGEPSP
jgi:uncharacterized protein (DUF433 family)